MKRNSMRGRWNPEIHSEDELWTCPFYHAEYHCDFVGGKCPACGEVLPD